MGLIDLTRRVVEKKLDDAAKAHAPKAERVDVGLPFGARIGSLFEVPRTQIALLTGSLLTLPKSAQMPIVAASRVRLDGADDIDADGAMIKGGGGALTREKIVASVAGEFVCIADGSKLVDTLGVFPLPVEVVPMARAAVARQLAALGGQPRLRMTRDGQIYKTDNGNVILDVSGLRIAEPKALEARVNDIPGVVTVGLFAKRGANVLLLGTEAGVQRRDF